MGSSQSISSVAAEIPPSGCELSHVHTLTEYDTITGKNIDYYNGRRFFTVSPRYYPQFKKGYFYGYYEVDDPE